MPESLDEVLRSQDRVIARRQAIAAIGENRVDRMLGRRWQVILPGIYSSELGTPSERQRRRAALLYAGADALLSDADALRLHGVPFVPDDGRVRVLVPDGIQRLSRDFVVVRRTARLPGAERREGLPVVPVARAVCEFGLRHREPRDVLAVVAAAVQQGRASVPELLREANDGPARGRPALLRAIAPVAEGVRSAPEADFKQLVTRSKLLPTALWNCVLELADGQRLSPDALFEDAALIHETNGREFHAAGDLFEAMQRRHDRLVAAGFTVLHNTPRRLREEGATVMTEVEECYRRLAGRGLPPGVRIISAVRRVG
jgi:hypothetical protein